jgi:translation elongation factor EF-Tu-like GTPase
VVSESKEAGMHWHVIEARIRYRTSEEGGRKGIVANGYRGQFYYDGEDHDGFQYFPDTDPSGNVELGREVRAFVQFAEVLWDQIHKQHLQVGKAFEIREGRRVVGEGTVTRLDVPIIEWKDIIH